MGCKSIMTKNSPVPSIQRLRIDAILDFWYKKAEMPDWDRMTSPGPAMMKFWYVSTFEKDHLIIDNFLQDYEKLIRGDYICWEGDRDGRLAAIILLDQFARSLYRKHAEAYTGGDKAVMITQSIINNQALWNQYKLYEKGFILMPLQHCENKTINLSCVTEV